MARGDMNIDVKSVSDENLILNRKEFDAVPMTVDFTGVVAENGKKVVKAGTPVDKDGKPVTTTPWNGVVGILLHDAVEGKSPVAMLKRAYIHTTRAQAHSGLTYDSAIVAALNNANCNIIFEEPIIIGGASSSN